MRLSSLRGSVGASAKEAAPACLLFLAVCFAYLPSFGAGFLKYDDFWLIADNPFYKPDAWRTPWLAFTDFSYPTRFALGAEYLPLRDLLGWLESRIFGVSAVAFHAVSVLLYASATLFLRAALVRTFGRIAWVELASLLFALHPVHAESVAWLAGQKDVLSLLFACAALFVHAGESKHARFLVPLLALCAYLAKSMSVALLVLLFAQDFVRARRPDRVLYALTTLVTLLALALHSYVGRSVGMVASMLGGSRASALTTMGPVWTRYLALAFWPSDLSIAHDVSTRDSWDLPAIFGYFLILLWLALGIVCARRSERRILYTFIWFFAPLAPVSQVLVPLQNRMADRYLWLSVLAPCLLFAWLVELAATHVPKARARLVFSATSAALCCAAFALTLERSVLFSNGILLFSDGTEKTEHSTAAPLLLGQSLEATGRVDEAMLAYAEVLERAGQGEPDFARASNNMANVFARRGRLEQAEHVLRKALERFPRDEKVRRNLVKVLRGEGRTDEAEALEKQRN